jgi:hypothetical protein
MSSNKDRNVTDLVSGTLRIRRSLDGLYKELIRLGAKVKYLEPVGPMVADAINEMIEAELALKRVVDTGNDWTRNRGSAK